MEENKVVVALDKFDIEYLIGMLIRDNQSVHATNEMLRENLRQARSRADLAERLIEEESA